MRSSSTWLTHCLPCSDSISECSAHLSGSDSIFLSIYIYIFGYESFSECIPHLTAQCSDSFSEGIANLTGSVSFSEGIAHLTGSDSFSEYILHISGYDSFSECIAHLTGSESFSEGIAHLSGYDSFSDCIVHSSSLWHWLIFWLHSSPLLYGSYSFSEFIAHKVYLALTHFLSA